MAYRKRRGKKSFSRRPGRRGKRKGSQRRLGTYKMARGGIRL